jgi:acetyl-CoA carboxylase carboxyl transferase subunit alpha
MALKLTAKDLIEMKIIDGMIKEPLGGAHRDPQGTAANLKKVIKKELASLKTIPKDKLIKARYDKIRSVGVFKES